MKISDFIFRFKSFRMREDGLCRVRLFVNTQNEMICVLTDIGEMSNAPYLDTVCGTVLHSLYKERYLLNCKIHILHDDFDNSMVIVDKYGNVERTLSKEQIEVLTECDENGFPNIKAMLKPRKINGLKEFYFSTNTSSLRVKQFLSNPNASIYFYRKGLIKYTGVMLVGKMEVLTDQKTKDMIWKKGDTMFYKKGVTDPDYCVLKFTAQNGRYYCDLKTESFEV